MKTFLTIVKVFITHSIVLFLGLFTVCMVMAVPESGDPDFTALLLCSKSIAIATGFITYVLARVWNFLDINNELNLNEVA